MYRHTGTWYLYTGTK